MTIDKIYQLIPQVTTVLDYLECIRKVNAPILRDLADKACVKGPTSLARLYVALNALGKELSETEKELSGVINRVKTELMPGLLEDHGQTNISLEEGFQIVVSTQMRASVAAGKREDAHQWLRDNGLGDIITPTVNAQTLSAAFSQMRKDNIDPPVDLFNVFHQPTTSVRTTASKLTK